MNGNETPKLEARDASAFLAEMLKRLPGYGPGWIPAEGGPSGAIIRIYAAFLQAVAERLNGAPLKNKLAFLDMLGLNLLPAQAARAPLVFKARPSAGDGRVPARTRVGAQVAGRGDPLVFETEAAIALAGAQIAEVVTLWPGRDAYADHSRAAIGGQPFALFQPLQAVPHELYLAHDLLLSLAGQAIVEVQFELAAVASEPMNVAWEYWDGQVWRTFKPFKSPPEAGELDSQDGTAGFTRSGVIRLVAECAQSKPTTVHGMAAHWLRGRLTGPLPPGGGLSLPRIDHIGIRTGSRVEHEADPALRPDLAFADALELDLSKSFYPFGQQPQPGTAFFCAAGVLGKPGAQVTLHLSDALTVLEQAPGASTPLTPQLVAEYWNGREWASLDLDSAALVAAFENGGDVELTVPKDVSPRQVNDVEGFWLRVRLASGTFGRNRTISTTPAITVTETVPPALADLRLSYFYRSPQASPQICLTYNDFQWQDHSEQARWRGEAFEPFSVTTDLTPALYLGFDRPLPADTISLYLDIQEEADRIQGPPLRWEYWDGLGWQRLSVQDETRNLALPGMVSFVWPGGPAEPAVDVVQAQGTSVQLLDPRQAARFLPGDVLYLAGNSGGEMVTVADAARGTLMLKTPLTQSYQMARIGRAGLPRFGTPRTWVRARMQSDAAPLQSRLHGIYLNASWAAQVQTVENEVLGASDGRPDQAFLLRQTPVLAGETIEVRELEGERAAIELPLLRQELLRQGLTDADIRTVSDRRSGRIDQVWVRWQGRPHLFFSGPDDRHYVIERSRGRLLFGDGVHGKIPPPGAGNIRAALYRSGGGQAGNVPAGAISQLLSGLLAQGASNPRAAEGGADGEVVAAVAERGPRTIRHRRQAITLADFEDLAREASPAVAAARALPATHPSGRPAPGWVRVIIMPQSSDPQPQPSFELRRQVRDFLAARAPAAIAGHITVSGPSYLPVGVEAVVVPLDPSAAGPVYEAVAAALLHFLNPLHGGPEGAGWPFGRDVYLSDVAAVIEAVDGVDYVRTLNLLLDGTPRGERVQVPPDRIVVAGPLRIALAGAER